MDSISKLRLNIDKIKSHQHTDDDVKTNEAVNEVKYFCNDFLKLYQNIEDTSTTNDDKLQRKKDLLNNLLN